VPLRVPDLHLVGELPAAGEIIPPVVDPAHLPESRPDVVETLVDRSLVEMSKM